LVDAAYDCDIASKHFRAHFNGNDTAEEFTASAIRSIAREMAHDGSLQFLHAAFTSESNAAKSASPCPQLEFNPAPRVKASEGGAEAAKASTLPWVALTEGILVRCLEHLGRSDATRAMYTCRGLHAAGRAVTSFWLQVVLLEESMAGEPRSSAAARFAARLADFAAMRSNEVTGLALRNTAVNSCFRQAGEMLLRSDDLQRCLLQNSYCVLGRLILHSFGMQELCTITSHGRLFPALRRLDLIQCSLSSEVFSELAALPALSGLGIWGLKNTQMMLPSCWPSGLQTIEELCLDPVEAAGPWPSFQGEGSPSRLHLRTTRPRLALPALPCGLQVLSLTTSAKDVSNPFVEAFALLDKHVNEMLSALRCLHDLVLGGHVKLGSASMARLAAYKGMRRLSLAGCDGLDGDESFHLFSSHAWHGLESFEAPGSRCFKTESMKSVLPQGCHCSAPACSTDSSGASPSRSLVPQPGHFLTTRCPNESTGAAAKARAESSQAWWAELVENGKRPINTSPEFHGPMRRHKPNSPLGQLAHVSNFLHCHGDFGEVCRGPQI